LIAYFRAEYDVERMSKDAQRRYERTRAAGGLRSRDGGIRTRDPA
jgi:hypothetical protein